MAKADDEFVRPNGERLIFRKAAHETNGDLLEMEVVYSPKSSKPPAHYHPYQEEHFEVLNGTIRAEIRGQTRSYEAGDSFNVGRSALLSGGHREGALASASSDEDGDPL